MEEGTLAKWHVKVGDTVRSGDVIAEIETDKATMEVEAVDEGVIEALLVPEGTEAVKVNVPIARLAGEGESASPPPAVPASSNIERAGKEETVRLTPRGGSDG
jgi:pyruvate/2-oxoglutarate dehydrogenase complex dihydrolipoamide acyltransferase (E2) component